MVRGVFQIEKRCRHDWTEAGRRRIHAHAQHASDTARSDQRSRARDGGVATQLQADRDVNARRSRHGCHLFGLGDVAAQGPFAIHVLARRQRSEHQFAMVRNAGRYRNEIDARRPDQIQSTSESGRNAERLGGRVRGALTICGDRCELETGQPLDRRSVPIARPTTLGARTDNPDS
jgi:hypothetical protein